MSKLTTTVAISRSKGRETFENEVRAMSLEEVYKVCREAPPSAVMRISIRGPEGEVRLNFASFIKQGAR